MEVENRCVSNISFLSFRVIFHFHDYGRKGKYLLFQNVPLFSDDSKSASKSFTCQASKNPRFSKAFVRYSQLSKIYHTFVYHNYGCFFPWFLKTSKLVALVFCWISASSIITIATHPAIPTPTRDLLPFARQASLKLLDLLRFTSSFRL